MTRVKTRGKPNGVNRTTIVGQPIRTENGLVSIEYQPSGKAENRTITLELVELKLALESVEMKHGYAEETWAPTPDFARDLAAALQDLGVDGIRSTAAYQVWLQVAERWAELAKKLLPTRP